MYGRKFSRNGFFILKKPPGCVDPTPPGVFAAYVLGMQFVLESSALEFTLQLGKRQKAKSGGKPGLDPRIWSTAHVCVSARGFVRLTPISSGVISMIFLSASLRLGGLLLLAVSALAQIPAPKDSLGFTPGDDRKLASWASIVDYFRKLDAASDRVMFEEIGKSTMGAPFVYATISSPENLKNLEKYKQINAKLADPRKIDDGKNMKSLFGQTRDIEARRLIAEGKTIVLITHGIHST